MATLHQKKVVFKKLIKQLSEGSIPNRQYRGCHTYNVPLTVIMQSVRGDKKQSKILRLANGLYAGLPYRSFREGVELLGKRISMRYGITWFQHCLLLDHLFSKYRGNSSIGYLAEVGAVCDYDDLIGLRDYETRKALDMALTELKLFGSKIPLKVILNPHLTNTILQFQLEGVIKNAK